MTIDHPFLYLESDDDEGQKTATSGDVWKHENGYVIVNPIERPSVPIMLTHKDLVNMLGTLELQRRNRQEVTELLNAMTTTERLDVIGHILNTYGLPRTMLVDILGWQGIDADDAQQMIIDAMARNP